MVVQMWFFVHKRFSNTNIKLISYLVDGMQLMISRELEIVGLEECPTYKKKKAIIRTQQYQILESKIALQHKKQAISFYRLTQFNQIQD